MDFNGNISSIRGGSVSADFSVGRAGQAGTAPKTSFGAPLADAGSAVGGLIPPSLGAFSPAFSVMHAVSSGGRGLATSRSGSISSWLR